MKPNQLVIIGGGTSIKEGISKGLWDKLQDRFTLGINYSHRYFKSTAQTYIDLDFYKNEVKYLKSLPLIIGKYHEALEKEEYSNTIMLPVNDGTYIRDLATGVYKSSLCGLFTLSLGIYLLDVGEIFLLGFDWGANKTKDKNGKLNTHFYQGDIKHRGIGKVNHYNTKGRADRDFTPYLKEKQCKIFNVSLKSKINNFPKISYDEFFKKLDNTKLNQEELREEIRKKLEEKIKELKCIK